MSETKGKFPAVLVSGVVCLLIGFGAGALIRSHVTAGQNAESRPNTGALEPVEFAPASPPASPNAVQLARLVGKLDTLTRQPLAVQLTTEEKKEVKEILTGLEAKDDLTEEEAKLKLDALYKALEKHKDVFIDTGYRWPTPFRIPGRQPPNPFKAGELSEDVKHLKSFRATLDK